MIIEFRKIYMKLCYEYLSNKLKKLAEKHNLNYEELENLYLQNIKQ